MDIGASLGLYTIHMLGYARQVWAFEPRPPQAAELGARLGKDRRLHIEAVALSDRNGRAAFRACPDDQGRSTLEEANTLQGLRVEPMTVPVRTLDSYGLRDVTCIKIDVEGHEEAVLRGASRTLERDRPALFMELEDRHNPGITQRVPRWLARFGYQQFCFCDGLLMPAHGCRRGNVNSIFLCPPHQRI